MDATIKPIPGIPGYLAGSDGTIWSAMPGRWGKYKSLHVIRPYHDKKRTGYLHVTLRANGVKRRYTVHGLVATAFLGLRPDGMVVCHRNLDSTDNRADNLMHATQAENIQQGVEAGRHVRGERQHLAKLTEDSVRAIRERLAAGESSAALARAYGVSKATIGQIKGHRTWRHLAAVSATA
jgi:DNA-binding transcriptional regulator YiaG